jgi:hypothetical protein
VQRDRNRIYNARTRRTTDVSAHSTSGSGGSTLGQHQGPGQNDPPLDTGYAAARRTTARQDDVIEGLISLSGHQFEWSSV